MEETDLYFEDAFRRTFALEGGEVNDEADRGGHTNYGITQATLDSARQRGVLSGLRSVSEITPELARRIYLVDYWRALGLEMISHREIAAELFDTAVNMGSGHATMIAQLALDYLGETLVIDGAMGPRTCGLINVWCRKDPQTLFKVLNGFQFIAYVELIDGALVDELQKHFGTYPENQRFARGWMQRIQEYRR